MADTAWTKRLDARDQYPKGIAMAKKRDVLDEAMTGWLESQTVDSKSDYIMRGRRFERDSEAELITQWKSALTIVMGEPQSAVARRTVSDLSSEFDLRNTTAPLDVPEWKAYVNFLIRRVEDLRESDPDKFDEIGQSVLDDLQKFYDEPKH
jgi:hypothetical protein